jgi:hypothetical protein
MARRPGSSVVVWPPTRNAIVAAPPRSMALAGPVDGRAHGEQAGRDEGRGADLAGQRERLVRQRDRAGRVTGEQVTGRGEGELCGGVGEVAAGPRNRRRVRPGGRGQPRGPTRSLIGCTLAVSQVKARQPRRQPPSIVASIE